MAVAALQARKGPGVRWRVVAAASLVAFLAGGCVNRSPQVTGSLAQPPAALDEAGWRRESAAWGRRFEANTGDARAALHYARALRGLGQHAQAVAVLQQAAMRNPKHLELLGAYGKALADVGRYPEAADVLARAHVPERPDWRILSAQGAVADQMDDHSRAQQYYEAALRIVPDEPGVLSNLGLSYALSKRLPDAERTLRRAADLPAADGRVRQNLAVVLALQGKLPEAETVLRRDLSPGEAAANLSALRAMVAQPNSWAAIRRAGGRAKPAPHASVSAAPKG